MGEVTSQATLCKNGCALLVSASANSVIPSYLYPPPLSLSLSLSRSFLPSLDRGYTKHCPAYSENAGVLALLKVDTAGQKEAQLVRSNNAASGVGFTERIHVCV